MKSIQLFFLMLFCISVNANAQAKAADKAVIKTPGITCEVCKDIVERNLFKMYGIGTVKADFKKHTVAVTWVTDRTNLEEIKTAIANAGFDADDVTAEETAYKRLPAACKVVSTPKPINITPPVIKKDTVLTRGKQYSKKN